MEQQTGYKIDNVFLISSNFWRKPEIDFEKMIVGQSNHVSAEPISPDNYGRFAVPLTVILTGTVDGEDAFKAECQMIGVFIKVGEPLLTVEKFSQVNGPAIVFPFVREHLAGLTLKGAVGNFLLQPVNFLPPGSPQPIK
jgi:preprotein translocase subunit SecB